MLLLFSGEGLGLRVKGQGSGLKNLVGLVLAMTVLTRIEIQCVSVCLRPCVRFHAIWEEADCCRLIVAGRRLWFRRLSNAITRQVNAVSGAFYEPAFIR